MNEFNSRNQQRYEPHEQGWQQQQPGAWGSYGAETAALAGVEERMGFIRKVYALFFAATLFAVAGVGVGGGVGSTAAPTPPGYTDRSATKVQRRFAQARSGLRSAPTLGSRHPAVLLISSQPGRPLPDRSL